MDFCLFPFLSAFNAIQLDPRGTLLVASHIFVLIFFLRFNLLIASLAVDALCIGNGVLDVASAVHKLISCDGFALIHLNVCVCVCLYSSQPMEASFFSQWMATQQSVAFLQFLNHTHCYGRWESGSPQAHLTATACLLLFSERGQTASTQSTASPLSIYNYQ